MQDRYVILKKLAKQKAKDEVDRLIELGTQKIEDVLVEQKLKLFEQEIFIEELKHERKKSDEFSSRYVRILKDLPLGYILCDASGGILDINEIGRLIFNIPPIDRSISRPLALSIIHEDRTRFLEFLTRINSDAKDIETTVKTTKDIILVLRGAKVSDNELIIILRDVTKTQQELKTLHLIKHAMDSANDAIIITDSDIKITYANIAFSRITGYTRSEVMGQNPSILKSGIYGKDFYEKFWHDLSNFGFWNGQIVDKNKHGKLSIHNTNITAISQNGIVTNYIAIFSDVTEQQEMNEKILELSIYDQLTRLPNRQMFKNRMEELCISNFSTGGGFTILFLDLDNFKFVNDTLGHSFGDEVLVEVARRLKNITRKSDLIARLGGDEFVIILENLTDEVGIQSVAENIVSTLGKEIHLSTSQNVNIGCSIGIAVYPDDSRNYEELVKFADTAMYKAKDEGKNKFVFYNEAMSQKSFYIAKIKNALQDAEKFGEMHMKFQPLFCAKTQKAVGVESLIRWNNVRLGEISPFEFIALAEKNGYIKELGRWIYDKALEEMTRSELFKTELSELAINISGVQLKEPTFIDNIVSTTTKYDFKPQNILLEVTESSLIEDLKISGDKLEQLRKMGFRVALDDFGTGFSSLSYLQKLPIDIVKIDKSFIDMIHKEKKSLDIVKTIINLAHCLGKSVVAEGVEHKEQAMMLNDANCDILQGYLFSVPVKAKYLKHHLNPKVSF